MERGTGTSRAEIHIRNHFYKTMYGRKRVYGSRGRSQSRPSKRAKKSNVVTVKRPRFSVLKNPHAHSVRNELRVKMTYFDWFTINPGTGGATGVYQFSANGLYDPNVTGVGHQPAGFDELMAIYGEYVVLGCTIKLIMSNTEGSNPALFGIFCSRGNSTPVDFREYVENGNGVYKTCDGIGTGSGMQTLTYSVDMNNESGHSILQDESFAGGFAANPTEQRFLQCVVQAIDFASDYPDINFCVEIDYDVIFRDRLKTPVS